MIDFSDELFDHSITHTFADVILPLHLPKTLTYRLPQAILKTGNVSVGQRVIVPVQSKLYTGIIFNIHQNEPTEYKTKTIQQVLDTTPMVSQTQLDFWQWIADYYLCYLGDVMQAALPSAFKLGSETYVSLDPDFAFDYTQLNDKEYTIAEALSHQNQLTIKDVIKILNQKTIFPIVKSLLDKQVIVASEEIIKRYKPEMEAVVRLAERYQERENLKILFDELEQNTKNLKQIDALIIYIQLCKNFEWIKRSDLAKKANCTPTVVAKLVDKAIFEAKTQQADRTANKDLVGIDEQTVVLSGVQQKSFLGIKNQFETQQTVLFHGVTSSGKTLIYAKLIEEVIQNGEQVLYLVPEIALTTQLIARLRHFFGDKIGVYHSKFNDNERAEIWQKAADGRYSVVLGARSAIFLPFKNLALVVIDEEHESSFKQQDPVPRYNARDAALYLARLHGAKTLLGSATPSIETYYNATTKKYGLETLSERFGGVQLPLIEMADTQKEYFNKTMKTNFTSQLLTAIEGVLVLKEQVILFQNRRGYVPQHECVACGYVPMCKNCDIPLTYHKANNTLNCHYCGYKTAPISVCKRCGSGQMSMKGFGTEKIEEQLGIYLPDAKIARLDQDATKTKNAFIKIITDFEQQKVEVLIGTQMVAKGLDFDNVTLVGVLNADQAMNFPDFRSHERAFQLLAQVSGRAGRKAKRGRVIIQSKQVHHALFGLVRDHDYVGFYALELVQREQFNYPPFCRLIKFTIKHKDGNRVGFSAHYLAQKMIDMGLGSCVLGPTTPHVARIKNWYLREIILKIDPMRHSIAKIKFGLRVVIFEMVQLAEHKSTQVIVDVDPY